MGIYKGEECTLLSFWEDYIPAHLHPIPLKERLEGQYEARSPGWGHKMPPELFREWAKEAGEVVCSQVYAPMEINDPESGNLIINPRFELSEEVFHRWVELAQD